MAGEASLGFLKILYGLAVYLLILECFYPFDQSLFQPESLLTNALKFQAKALSLWFETWSFYTLMVYIIFFAIKCFVKIYLLVAFYFQPALRDKVKEFVRKCRERRQAKQNQKPSACMTIAFTAFLPIMAINGAIFNRAEGSDIVQGAIQQYMGVVTVHLPIVIIEINGFFMILSLAVIFAVVRRRLRGKKAPSETERSVEEGLPSPQVSEKEGIYVTTKAYIVASIVDEKLVDIDEKLVDIDEPSA